MTSQPGKLWSPQIEKKTPPLSREAIVAAAIELADAEGIQAVSIRKVAARLDARPMSLYSHFDRKDDLIDLMVDETTSEVLVAGELPDDWREALRTIAHRTRQSCLRHPWVLTTLGQRTLFGPNTLRHVDQSLGAVASLTVSPEVRTSILVAVDTFVVGQVAREIGEIETQRRNGLSETDWRIAISGYLDEVVTPDEYPHLAAFGTDRLLGTVRSQDERFRAGLEWLLDGIAATVQHQQFR